MKTQNTKSNRLAIILGLGLGLAALGWVVWDSPTRGDVEKLKNESVALQAKLDAANRRVKSLTTGDEKLRLQKEGSGTQPSGANSAPAPVAVAAAAKSEHKRNVNAEEMAAMIKNPMMQKIIASQTTAVTQMTYGDLMNRFQLSPEERDYMQKLLVEKQTNVQNLGMQLMNPGLSSDERGAIMQQLGEAWAGGEAKIRDFLNDDADYAYYQSYAQQEPEHREVGMFEASLPGGDSLDPATSDALANLQSTVRKNFSFTVDFYDQRNFGNPAVLNSATVHKFLDEQTQFQAQVAEKAADLLSPAQLQVFKQNQAAVRQMSQMQLNSIVQMANGGQ